MGDVTCRRCGEHQAVALGDLSVRVIDLPSVRDVLDGRPAALRCRACADVLPVSANVAIDGDGWQAEVVLDGPGNPPPIPEMLTAALRLHLEGIVGALWRAPDRAAQHAIARERYLEFSAEAIAAALLAAEGRLPGWVVGDGAEPLVAVDDMLGPPQASALISAVLSLVPESEPSLSTVIERHVSAGLVLPRAAEDLSAAVSAMIGTGQLEARERLAVLAVHAGARLAAGLPDPLARAFTREWITFAWAADERPEDLRLQRLRPPADLVARAVDPSELTAAVLETTDAPPGWMERMQRIAEQAGYPRLIRQVARNAPVMSEVSSDVLRGALAEVARTSEPQRLAEGLRFVLGALRAAGRVEELETMTDHALELSDGSDTTRAMLLVQLGSATKDARMPSAFLNKVGGSAAAWETKLPDQWRLALDTERSTALRMTGRAKEAQLILRPYLEVPLETENRWRLEFNLALIDRDAGAADLGLRATEDLLARASDDDERFLAHQSLARTVTELGRQSDSVTHLRAAIGLAYGEHAHHEPVLRASLAAVLAAGGDIAGALDELAGLDGEPLAPQAALGVADAIAVLLEQGEDLEADQIEATKSRLETVTQRARADGDRTVEASALRVRARLNELLGDLDGAAADWETLLDFYRDPLALVSLATLRGVASRQDEARALLLQVPEALLDDHGGAADLGAIIDSTGRVHAALRQLSTTMMGGRPLPGDVRLAAELSRDAIGRVRMWASSQTAVRSRRVMAAGLPEEDLRTLAPDTGALWVLEWWEASQGVVTLLTRIGADGDVTMRALSAMPVFAPDVAQAVLARLQSWWPGRPGDPLAHVGWNQLGDWLRAELNDATNGDHLVVVEHAGLTGLPWHAIDDARWTTSYAPSWTALLDLPETSAAPRAGGVVSVTARGDAAATRGAFAHATRIAGSQANRRGIKLEVLEGIEADATATLALLERSDLVTLLCHGLIDPDQLDLALLLAANGQLPSQHPIAASSSHARAHRLTWRAMQEVSTGPSVLLSAACSTGQGLIGGLGERLGLFGALRSRGTRAVVAPAWDGVAMDVVAQVGEVRELLLDGAGVAQAVKEVGDRAAERLPTWRARALCVEGDWR